MEKDLWCAALIPDTHRPFHDKRAYKLMLEVLTYLNPKEIIIMGDYADFYNVNFHGRDPGIRVDLTKEIEDVSQGLDELDILFPDSTKAYICGNHEYRLERYIAAKAPELFGITDWELLLGFADRQHWKTITYSPDQAYPVLGSKLSIRHEPMPMSGNPSQVVKNFMGSVAYGHIHRILEGYAVDLYGNQIVAFCPGWLGNKHHPVFKYVKSYWQWQLGFGLVWVDPHTKKFYHQKIAILDDYTCLVNGKRFKA